MKPIRKSKQQPTDGTFDNRPFQYAEDRESERVKIRAQKTKHDFRTDVMLRDNEEMHPLSDAEILDGKVVRDPNAVSKCCRFAFTHADKQIANVFRVHGEGIALYQQAQKGDIDEGIPPDQPYGWDMTKPEEGYPCMNLLPNGKCKIQDKKPFRCGRFPASFEELRFIETCSYTADENGNRTGTCNGCGAF